MENRTHLQTDGKQSVVNNGTLADYSGGMSNCIKNSQLTPVYSLTTGGLIMSAALPFTSINVSNSMNCSPKFDDAINLSPLFNCPVPTTIPVDISCGLGARTFHNENKIQNEKSNEELEISPTPGSEFVLVNNLDINKNFYIYNSLGDLVYHDKANGKIKVLNIGSYPNGIYFILNGDRKGKIIKN